MIDKYDYIINHVIDMNIPEVDIDHYSPALGISVSNFAKKKALSFVEETEQDMSTFPAGDSGQSKTSPTAVSRSTGGNQSDQGQVETASQNAA